MLKQGSNRIGLNLTEAYTPCTLASTNIANFKPKSLDTEK